MTEFPIARACMDASLGRIGGGRVEVRKAIIARGLLPANRRRAPG